VTRDRKKIDAGAEIGSTRVEGAASKYPLKCTLAWDKEGAAQPVCLRLVPTIPMAASRSPDAGAPSCSRIRCASSCARKVHPSARCGALRPYRGDVYGAPRHLLVRTPTSNEVEKCVPTTRLEASLRVHASLVSLGTAA